MYDKSFKPNKAQIWPYDKSDIKKKLPKTEILKIIYHMQFLFNNLFTTVKTVVFQFLVNR